MGFDRSDIVWLLFWVVVVGLFLGSVITLGVFGFLGIIGVISL